MNEFYSDQVPIISKYMLHPFIQPISHIALPEQFTYPFHYTPHQLCILAAEEVQKYIASQVRWKEELQQGKMFGVLVVQTAGGAIGYLSAFSGNLVGKNRHSFFVPPIYDLLRPDSFFKIEEEKISAMNVRIRELEQHPHYLDLKKKLEEEENTRRREVEKAKYALKVAKEAREQRRKQHPNEDEQAAMVRESQYQKAEFKRLEKYWKNRIAVLQIEIGTHDNGIASLKKERKKRSAELQQRLFKQFKIRNGLGEVKDLCAIFEQTVQKTPPAGAGECAAPKLLQYAYLHGLKPLAMAEFWWGNSPKTEIRHHGYYYPACKGKCEPILKYMLKGLDVEPDPLSKYLCYDTLLDILYEDDWLLVVDKPAGMLSVPGKASVDSVYSLVKKRYPDATGPMIVHRLDMATSGLLLIAKTKEVHLHLQAQFKDHTIKKRYIALLDGIIALDEGEVKLPLCSNPWDRPRQVVNEELGKLAVTRYKVLERKGNQTRIAFYPLTGRTHQLRVHASHPLGLNCPIIGDELYGKKADRLFLHAESLEFVHPVSGKVMTFKSRPEF